MLLQRVLNYCVQANSLGCLSFTLMLVERARTDSEMIRFLRGAYDSKGSPLHFAF